MSQALPAGSDVSQIDTTYDANGNRTQQVELQNGLPTAPSLTTDYRYDALDRLVGFSETGPGQVTEHRFTYYPSYDRKTEVVVHNGVTLKNRSYDYNGSFELTQVSETAGGSITYQYDANGNRIHSIDTTGGRNHSSRFEYNSRNQLTRVAHGAPGSERGDIEYLYDGDSIIDELHNNSTSLVAHYRYGDRLLSLTSGGSDQFYHYASLGTTANLTNAAGAEQVAYRTDPFGQITQQEGSSVNRHVFTGQEHDEQTGLIYFGARFYDPDVAGFINQDSYLGESTTPPSLHRYLYAYSNPTVYVDGNGHFAVLEGMAEGLKEMREQIIDSAAQSNPVMAAVQGLGAGLVGALEFGTNAANLAGDLAVDTIADENSDSFFVQDSRRSLSETKETLSGIKDAVVNNPAEVAANIGQGISNTVAGIATGDSRSIAHGAEFAFGVFTGGEISSASKSVAGSVGTALRESKVVASATVTVERGLLAGSSQVSQLAKSASNGIKRSYKAIAEKIRQIEHDTPSLSRESVGDADALGAKCVGSVCSNPMEGQCFVAGTLVQTQNGLMPIEQIKEGDLIASRDDHDHSNSSPVYKPVVRLFRNHNKEIIDVTLASDDGQTETLGATLEHPFHVQSKGWTGAGQLVLGDKIDQLSGKALVVKALKRRDKHEDTYNFEVADTHSYFVGKTGAWVHNVCDIAATSETATVILRYQEGMPRHEFAQKVATLQDLGDQGLLFKAANPVARDPAITRAYRQDMIKRIWAQYGQTNKEFANQLIDRITRKMQPDHIHELQLGGPDVAGNLKFLDSFTNWHIGTQQIRPQIRNLPVGSKIKIQVEGLR